MLTFTTAGANEFAARVKLACGAAAAGLQVATFHSFCLGLCKAHRSVLAADAGLHLSNHFLVFRGVPAPSAI